MGSRGITASAYGDASNIGAALRAAREFRGLSLQDLADATRIRRSYLAALEEMKLEALPSRPFTIGYVRAVSQALGQDPDEAVARFKQDAPDRAEPLRAPIGVSRERDPRLSMLAGGAAIVLCAVLVWNLAQHAVAEDGQPSPAVPDAVAGAPAVLAPPGGAVVLTAPQPAPQESEIPAPYVTPGLAEAQLAAGGDPAAVQPQAAIAPAPTMAPPARTVANPRAATYGAAQAQSRVTLQARKPAALIIRGADGAVYFARQLASGESYRAPMLGGLTVDVSDPAAFDVYADGAFKGQLPAAQTAIGKLAG